MAKAFVSGVVPKETLVKARRKWIFWVILKKGTKRDVRAERARKKVHP